MNTTTEEKTEKQLLKELYEETFQELMNLFYDPMNIESNYQIYTYNEYNEDLKFWIRELL